MKTLLTFNSIFLFIFLFLTITQQASASTLFLDQFNGNGDLHIYNNLYINQISWFAVPTTMNVANDHLVLNTNDGRAASVYLYAGMQSGDNQCVSVDTKQESNVGTWNTLTNLLLRTTTDGSQFEEIDIRSGTTWIYITGSLNNNTQIQGSIIYDPFQYHTLKACINGKTVSAYLDNTLMFQTQHFTDLPGYYGFAAEYPVDLDNFKIENIESGGSSLNVPLLKQISEPWQGQTYDNANIWNPSDPTINSWGCAMTSAAMTFKYHGINVLPDGTALDPGSLNTWLENQSDGYVTEGWVNWLALSRMSKLAVSLYPTLNGSSGFDALEYHRSTGTDADMKELLREDLQGLNSPLNDPVGLPDILEEPGHFIVATGTSSATFTINDPYYPRTTLNDGYNNTFLSLGRYIPANSDLSYIMLVADPGTPVNLLDNTNTMVGSSFTQQPISNPNTPSQHNNSLQYLLYAKPDTKKYKITVGNTIFTGSITVYLYDINGNVKITTLNPSAGDTFVLDFNKSNSNNSSIYKQVTFDSTIADIMHADSLNQINHGMATSLIALITNAKKEYLNGNIKNSLNMLTVAIKLLNTNQSKMDAGVYQTLFSDFNTLVLFVSK